MPDTPHKNTTHLLMLAISAALTAPMGCGGEAADSPQDVGSHDAGAQGDAGRTDDVGTEEDAGTSTRDAGGPANDVGAHDMGAAEDGGGGDVTQACAARSAEIAAGAGATIVVSPADAQGQVNVEGGGSKTLRQVVSGASSGDTILLEDGTYTFPPNPDGSYTGLYFTTPNVTLRSASGDASKVTLDSAYLDHGNSSAPITIAAPGVVVANLTVKRSIYHLIHLWADGDQALVHDVTLVDGGQQFIKASPGGDAHVDEAEISCSRFVMTDEGRDNVWGYGSSDGNTTCYTGGIDTHDSRDWHIHDNHFEGIYCDASGPQRPAHGKDASSRGGMTYNGGLAEHAIHMWDSEEGSAHVIERNTIVDCARGIGLGFRTEVFGTIIRNNTIASAFPGAREHDVAISVERGRGVEVVHNTAFYSHPDGYSSAIEYRWGETSDVTITNNLTNRRIRARDGATAALEGNVTDAAASAFVDAPGGDLHLRDCQDAALATAGSPAIGDDLDGAARSPGTPVGADACD